MKIWLVRGVTGEHADREEWVVCAFKDKQKAIDLAIAASQRAEEIYAALPSRYSPPTKANEYDPGMEMDYTGTDYSVLETELRD